MLGGPVYQLLTKIRAVRPPVDLLHRRIFAAIAIAWLPLAVLTALAGHSTSGVRVPFLMDLDVHIKLLISLPLLIAAELIVHRRMRPMVQQFLDRDLIAPEDRGRFEEIVADSMRLRNSVPIEMAMVLLVFTAGYWLWRAHTSLSIETWHAASGADGMLAFTPAGYWYALVSLPIARFILLRWFFRIAIWYLFLARVSRLRLRLNPLHPDGAGGLTFLSGSIDAQAPILVAFTAFLSGQIANQILYQGATLASFKIEMIAVTVLLMLIVLLPLTFFAFQLAEAKRTGLREFGLLSSRYAAQFHRKWMGPAGAGEPLLGAADIQSLSDLAGAYDVVRNMRPLPFGRNHIVRLAIIVAAPLLPLTLTMVPFEEALDRIIKLLL